MRNENDFLKWALEFKMQEYLENEAKKPTWKCELWKAKTPTEDYKLDEIKTNKVLDIINFILSHKNDFEGNIETCALYINDKLCPLWWLLKYTDIKKNMILGYPEWEYNKKAGRRPDHKIRQKR